MGPVCVKKGSAEEIPAYQQTDQIKVIDLKELRAVRFEFTNRSVSNLSGDLLVLFMGRNLDVRGHDHLANCKLQARKIQEYAIAYLDSKNLRQEQQSGLLKFITFDVKIPEFNFKRVSLIFCDVWKKQRHNDSVLGKDLRQYFQDLQGTELNSMVITQFQPSLGVHLEKGVRRLMRQIVRTPTKPELIRFVCLSEESKEIYMQCIQENRQDLIQSFASRDLSNQSDYF